MKTIRVLIAEDQPAVREGLAAVLAMAGSATKPRLAVAGLTRCGEEAVRQTRSLTPDALLVDLDTPGTDGFETIRRVKEAMPSVRVIVLSIQNDAAFLLRAWEAGADGIAVKDDGLDVLLRAILGEPVEPGPTNRTKGEKP